MSDLDTQIAAVLDTVMDPCSVAAGAPLALTDMGLVRGWDLDEAGRLTVRLGVTSPLCLMAGHFVAEAQTRLSELEAISSAEVVVEPTLDWSPDKISERGQRLLARSRGSGSRADTLAIT